MILGEIRILQWLEALRTPTGITFWEAVTFLGEDLPFLVLVAVIYFIFDKKLACRICFLTAASLCVNGIVKNILRVSRPFAAGAVTCARPETATGYSFPSGHTQNFATWSMSAASYRRKKYLMALSVLLTLAIGFSRIYLGAHYLSDVLAAAVLGLGIGWGGNQIADGCRRETNLYAAVLFFMMPFFAWFLWKGDPLFEDFFKCYGLLAGFLLAVWLEETFINLSLSVPLWKRILRCILGLIAALLLRLLLSCIPVAASASVLLLWDSVRYFLLVVAVFGIYPMILKKLKL